MNFAEVQSVVQRSMVNGRDLLEYSDALSPWSQPVMFLSDDLPEELSRFSPPESKGRRLNTNIDASELAIPSLLRRLNGERTDPVHWADFGGGFGIAQREYRHDFGSQQDVQTTNITLTVHSPEIELRRMRPHWGDAKYRKVRELLCDEYAPRFLREDIETVNLAQPADLITSVQCLQYTLNPLLAIVNMYRNLKPGGIMAMMCEKGLSSTMHYPDSTEDLVSDFTSALTQAQIPYMYSHFQKNQYGTLTIVKAPCTSLKQIAQVIPDFGDPFKMERRHTMYRRPKKGGPVTVIAA